MSVSLHRHRRRRRRLRRSIKERQLLRVRVVGAQSVCKSIDAHSRAAAAHDRGAVWCVYARIGIQYNFESVSNTLCVYVCLCVSDVHYYYINVWHHTDVKRSGDERTFSVSSAPLFVRCCVLCGVAGAMINNQMESEKQEHIVLFFFISAIVGGCCQSESRVS